MVNISKVQAHKLLKAATSTLQLVQSPKGKFQFPWLFPEFFDFPWPFLNHFGIPWLFQIFQVSGDPAAINFPMKLHQPLRGTWLGKVIFSFSRTMFVRRLKTDLFSDKHQPAQRCYVAFVRFTRRLQIMTYLLTHFQNLLLSTVLRTHHVYPRQTPPDKCPHRQVPRGQTP